MMNTPFSLMADASVFTRPFHRAIAEKTTQAIGSLCLRSIHLSCNLIFR